MARSVKDLCVREVAAADPRDPVVGAARRMRDENLGTLVVLDALRRPLGIVTDRDLALRCLAEPREPGRTRLEDVMSAPVIWIREDASVEATLEEMARLRVRRLPVVDRQDRLVGIVALDDLLLDALAPESGVARALRASL